MGTLGGTAADNAATWQSLTGGQDRHSVPGEPQMANPGAATAEEFAYDYHLNGRDAGTPASRAARARTIRRRHRCWTRGIRKEAPEKSRNPAEGQVNIGVWGGTEEASKAPAAARSSERCRSGMAAVCLRA